MGWRPTEIGVTPCPAESAAEPMEEIGPIVVTFRFCIIMQGRTGACRVSHTFSGFMFL